MTTTIKLSDTQRTALLQAAKRPDGNIEPLPGKITGGARAKVIQGLINRQLIGPHGGTESDTYHLLDAGYAAVGRRRPAQKDEETVAPEKTTHSRDNSKQAQVIAMLKRPEGATIAQICETTGWQAHTVRGTFAGAFKKKLKLDITSTKEPGADRVYMISAGA
ncbi:MAG: hypothetical protein NVSMB6_00200 [Burkholderiaceae bacterium]